MKSNEVIFRGLSSILVIHHLTWVEIAHGNESSIKGAPLIHFLERQKSFGLAPGRDGGSCNTLDEPSKEAKYRSEAEARLYESLSTLDHVLSVPVASSCGLEQPLHFRVLDKGQKIITFSHGASTMMDRERGYTGLFEIGRSGLGTNVEQNFYSPPRLYPYQDLKGARFSGSSSKKVMEPDAVFGTHSYSDTLYQISRRENKNGVHNRKGLEQPTKDSKYALSSIAFLGAAEQVPKKKNEKDGATVSGLYLLNAEYSRSENFDVFYDTQEEIWSPDLSGSRKEGRFVRFLRRIFKARKPGSKPSITYARDYSGAAAGGVFNEGRLPGGSKGRVPVGPIVNKVEQKASSGMVMMATRSYQRTLKPVYTGDGVFSHFEPHDKEISYSGFGKPLLSGHDKQSFIQLYPDGLAVYPQHKSSAEKGGGVFLKNSLNGEGGAVVFEDPDTGDFILQVQPKPDGGSTSVGGSAGPRLMRVDRKNGSVTSYPHAPPVLQGDLSFLQSSNPGEMVVVSGSADEFEVGKVDLKSGSYESFAKKPKNGHLDVHQDLHTKVSFLSVNDSDKIQAAILNPNGTLSKQSLELESGEQVLSMGVSRDPETGAVYTEVMTATKNPFVISQKSFGPGSSKPKSSKSFPELAKALLRDAQEDSLLADAFNPCGHRKYYTTRREKVGDAEEDKIEDTEKSKVTLYPNPFEDQVQLKLEGVDESVMKNLDSSQDYPVVIVDSMGKPHFQGTTRFQREPNGSGFNLVSESVSTAGLKSGKYIVIMRDPSGKAHPIHGAKK